MTDIFSVGLIIFSLIVDKYHHNSHLHENILTPSRKKIGKAVARKSFKSIARECFKLPQTHKYILQHLGVLLRKEIKYMCSQKVNSILQRPLLHVHDSPFIWSSLMDELKTTCTSASLSFTALHKD